MEQAVNIENGRVVQSELLLTIPKTPRKSPRKSVFQKDVLSSFRDTDAIEKFA